MRELLWRQRAEPDECSEVGVELLVARCGHAGTRWRLAARRNRPPRVMPAQVALAIDEMILLSERVPQPDGPVPRLSLGV